MKNKILEGLKAKYPDVQDSILSRIADKLAKTVTAEDQVDTAVAGVTIQQIIESYGDSRATEATTTAVANYEKKHNLKEGKPNAATDPKTGNKKPGSTDDDDDDDKTPAWAKALIESNKALENKIKAIEGEKVVTSRTKKLESILEEIKMPEKMRSTYRRTVGKMNFENDEEFETFLTEMKEEVEPLVAEMIQKGAVFQSRPPGGNRTPTEKEPPAEVKERIESRQTEQAAPGVIKGLPTAPVKN